MLLYDGQNAFDGAQAGPLSELTKVHLRSWLFGFLHIRLWKCSLRESYQRPYLSRHLLMWANTIHHPLAPVTVHAQDLEAFGKMLCDHPGVEGVVAAD